MAQIGHFTRDKSGFSGRIQTLTFYRDLSLVPAESSDAENAPDYRVHMGDADGPEIGAGWKRTGEKAGEYVSLVIDDAHRSACAERSVCVAHCGGGPALRHPSEVDTCDHAHRESR